MKSIECEDILLQTGENEMKSKHVFFGFRFNNLFQAAGALHFHRQGLMDFLSNYMASLNWKQEGTLADMQCDILDNHLNSYRPGSSVLPSDWALLVSAGTRC